MSVIKRVKATVGDHRNHFHCTHWSSWEPNVFQSFKGFISLKGVLSVCRTISLTMFGLPLIRKANFIQYYTDIYCNGLANKYKKQMKVNKKHSQGFVHDCKSICITSPLFVFHFFFLSYTNWPPLANNLTDLCFHFLLKPMQPQCSQKNSFGHYFSGWER